MRPILETCQPRDDLLTGAFNPEIFTAVLSQVLDYYRGNPNVTQNIYTDAEAFFTEATYATQGMKSVLSDVFGRLAGDNSLPAIHRLETAFGGSNAELADLHNPHPQGYPMHEWAWRVVFLHSLVGRDAGLQSELFGLTEQQALFEVAFPGLTPPQVQTALAEITDRAFYLRMHEGRYYASLDPSMNVALARLRRTLASSERVTSVLDATARKIVRADITNFHVVHDVLAPEHVPDKKDRPVLAGVTKAGEATEGYLEITNPSEACPLIRELHK